jgi:hypothetical protein
MTATRVFVNSNNFVHEFSIQINAEELRELATAAAYLGVNMYSNPMGNNLRNFAYEAERALNSEGRKGYANRNAGED